MEGVKPEVLAPAGSTETLLAAIRCGADAVYLGGGAFNARAGAQNFTREALIEAGRLCRTHGVRLYFTLNTLLSDRELPQAVGLAREAVRAGASAVIVQDMGLLHLLREALPGLSLHASTQCSVQAGGGMALLKQLGASRCIVPRECTKEELAALIESAPLELEAFVHGALCMSVSGQCLMSFAMGGRSGNKGTCAQPCRLPFSIEGASQPGNPCALSLKDLSLLDEAAHFPLNRMASLKIEGRLKRPEYVAAAVTAFRHALDGTSSPVSEDDLRQAFSRSGFTQGYYQNRRDGDMFGVRQKEDAARPETLRRMAAFYAGEAPRVPLDFHFEGQTRQPVSLAASALGERVCIQGGILEPAQTQSLSEEDVLRQLGRLGGTQYFLRDAQIKLAEEAFLPLGQLNALRRAALEALENKIAASEAFASAEKIGSAHELAHNCSASNLFVNAIILRFLSHAQIPDSLPEGAQIFLPCDTPPDILARHGAQVVIPAGVFGDSDKILAQLRRAQEAGASLAMAQTLDGVWLAREAGLTLVAGEGMNALNSASLEALRRLGCAGAVLSAEVSAAQARDLQSHIPFGAMVYGRLALMLCRNCPVKAQIGCKECKNGKNLIDRKNAIFPVRCENGCAKIYNSRPLWLADVRDKLPSLEFRLFSFTTETKEECAAVLRAYHDGEACAGEFTRGWMK